jgi:hypothetical protein
LTDPAGRFALTHVPTRAEQWCVVAGRPGGGRTAVALKQLGPHETAKVTLVIP